MVPLFYRDFGGAGKPPLVVLHGLLGSSRNWQSVGHELAATHHVLAVDLRNHGQSPHDREMSYDGLVADVLAWLDEQRIERPVLLGHSLGGKVAMALACRYADRLASLIVVDIAPRDYDDRPLAGVLAAMQALDLAELRSRSDAERRLEAGVPERSTRQFLATNLERDASGRFFWRVNLPVLAATLVALARSPLAPTDQFAGPALFVAGGRSDHVRAADHAVIHAVFPRARIEILPQAGHNPHIDCRTEFVALVRRFL